MLTDNTNTAERPALPLINTNWFESDFAPDEPYITDYEPCPVVEFTPIEWEDNMALRCFVDTLEYDDQPDFWGGSCSMVPFTLIEWIGSKAEKLHDIYIEFDFNFDKQPEWADLPF